MKKVKTHKSPLLILAAFKTSGHLLVIWATPFLPTMKRTSSTSAACSAHMTGSSVGRYWLRWALLYRAEKYWSVRMKLLVLYSSMCIRRIKESISNVYHLGLPRDDIRICHLADIVWNKWFISCN